jgi:hypothetical protein
VLANPANSGTVDDQRSNLIPWASGTVAAEVDGIGLAPHVGLPGSRSHFHARHRSPSPRRKRRRSPLHWCRCSRWQCRNRCRLAPRKRSISRMSVRHQGGREALLHVGSGWRWPSRNIPAVSHHVQDGREGFLLHDGHVRPGLHDGRLHVAAAGVCLRHCSTPPGTSIFPPCSLAASKALRYILHRGPVDQRALRGCAHPGGHRCRSWP